MSISIYHSRQKSGSTLTYIREVYRDPITHRPTSRTLESFGKVIDDPEAMKKVVARLEYYRKNSRPPLNSLAQKYIGPEGTDNPEEGDNAHCIGFAPYLKLWDELGLGSFLKAVGHNNHLCYDLNKYSAYLCCQRIFAPLSKRATWCLCDKSAFDFGDIGLNHLYETLDELQKRKNKIVDMLNESAGKMVGRKMTIALYDVTTLYFESFDPDELRRRGLSKEHRTQETQVVLGLLVDADGMPLDYELFPGNTAEIHTMLRVVRDYAERYGLGEVTIVADAGLNQIINLHRLQESGYRFIVNWPPYSKLKKVDREEFLKEEGWLKKTTSDGDEFKFKEMATEIKKTVPDTADKTDEFPEGKPVDVDLKLRIVGTYSESRRAHDVEAIEEKWEKAKKMAEKGPRKYASSSKRGARAYLETEVKSVKPNDAYYRRKLKWAGYTAVATNIPQSEVGGAEIYRILRQLWRVEYDFRLLKTNLEARPVFVWKPSRIRGHVLVCYISLMMLRLMGRILKEARVDISEQETVLALKTQFVSPVAALNSVEKGIVHYICIPEKSQSANNGLATTRQYEAKRIFNAVGIKPLCSLETLHGLRTKLGVKFDLRKDLAG